MNTNDWIIVPMQKKHDFEICHWKYEGIYAFYNPENVLEDVSAPEESVENSYAVLDAEGGIVGYFHSGPEGQIPTAENYDYTPDYLDIGIAMRPDLCGHGYGPTFVRMGLDFAKETLKAERIRLSVAAFNERAVRAYQKAGFIKVAQVTNAYFKNEFYIMTVN